MLIDLNVFTFKICLEQSKSKENSNTHNQRSNGNYTRPTNECLTFTKTLNFQMNVNSNNVQIQIVYAMWKLIAFTMSKWNLSITAT